MIVELVLVICAFVFAIYSFNKVFAASVIREVESTPESPSGLARRAANYDLERAAAPKRVHESWFNFFWVRTWRAISAYVRCKMRTKPGLLDLAIVGLFLAAAGLTWLDVFDKGLDLLRDYWEAKQAELPRGG